MSNEEDLHIGFEDKEKATQQDEDHKEDVFNYGDFATNDLEEDDEDISLVSIVRRILAAPKIEEEDWRRTSIFQMLVRYGNQAKKLIIDGKFA